MNECDHNCPITPETTQDELRHYLDCPVWVSIFEIERIRRGVNA